MAENPENNATTIGVVKESVPGETRVGLIPDSVKHLVGKGLQVVVQAGAGEGSSISDAEYEDAGARIVSSFADVHDAADVVVRVQAPAPDRGELEGLKRDQVLVSYLAPLVNHDLNRQIAATGVTAMAMDAVPRITRAQSMDSLSAMSTISGYKAVLMAAETLPKFFPLLMTAAGTIRPARVLVLGAGVAGLQAIATARRLGAVVEAYDVRAVVKEQVQSLGAKFVEIDTGAGNAEAAGGYAREATPEELKKQQEGLNDHIANSDVVITTALVPGRPAPKMIPASAVERMRTGSVIVDLAAETGGNCELTTPGEVTKEHGVTIFGTLNLPATLPVHASQMYGKVVTNFLDLLIKDGQVNLNFDDEIISSMAITHQGEIVQAQTRKMMGLDELAPAAAPAAAAATADASVTDETIDADDVSDAAIADEADISTGEPTTYRPFEDGDDDSAGDESLGDAGEVSTYRPFADDVEVSEDSGDATDGSFDDDDVVAVDESLDANDVSESGETPSTYSPFINDAPLNDPVSAEDATEDPATEIVSFSASDEGEGNTAGEYVTADEIDADSLDPDAVYENGIDSGSDFAESDVKSGDTGSSNDAADDEGAFQSDTSGTADEQMTSTWPDSTELDQSDTSATSGESGDSTWPGASDVDVSGQSDTSYSSDESADSTWPDANETEVDNAFLADSDATSGEGLATDTESNAFSWTYSDSVLNSESSEEGTDTISTDDGSESVSTDDQFSLTDESDGLSTDDGSELGDTDSSAASDASSATTSAGFSASVPEVDHVNEYNSGNSGNTVEPNKLESFLSDEEFSGADDASDADDDDAKSVPDARKNSKLPLVGEGTDWVPGDGSHDIPAGFTIKGNANSGIYHPEESPSYGETIAEIYFVSGEVAEHHGYRLPKMLQKAADKLKANESAGSAEEESDNNE